MVIDVGDGGQSSERTPGDVERETIDLVDGLRLDAGDPRRVTAKIAIRLARQIDETGAAAAARELPVLLNHLTEIPGQQPGPIDEIRAQRHARRIKTLIKAG